MAILIKDMEMPTTCISCDFHKCAGGVGDFCVLTRQRQFRFKNRPASCPLVEIPEPHGRLIDADAAYDALSEAAADATYSSCVAFDMDIICAGLAQTPTIIPATAEGET